jgi:hypothetical protein
MMEGEMAELEIRERVELGHGRQRKDTDGGKRKRLGSVGEEGEEFNWTVGKDGKGTPLHPGAESHAPVAERSVEKGSGNGKARPKLDQEGDDALRLEHVAQCCPFIFKYKSKRKGTVRSDRNQSKREKNPDSLLVLSERRDRGGIVFYKDDLSPSSSW